MRGESNIDFVPKVAMLARKEQFPVSGEMASAIIDLIDEDVSVDRGIHSATLAALRFWQAVVALIDIHQAVRIRRKIVSSSE